MPITTGQALALGNLARPDTTKVFSQAAMRKQQLDLAEKAAEAKRKEEENKLRKELQGMVGFGKGGFDPLFQDRAAKIISQGVAEQMKYVQSGDRIGINSRKAQMDAELADLLEENKRFRGTLDEMERNGLSNKEITKILNMRGTDAVDYYKKIATERPEVQSFINLDDPKEGKFTANYINNIRLDEELQKASKMLEETATPVYDKGKPVYQQIGHTKLYQTAANPQARQQVAMSLASTKDGVDNVKLLHPKEYKQAFEALSVEAQNKGLQVDPLQIQQAAAAQVLDNQLAKMSVYNIKESDWKPTKDMNINLGGGFGAITYDVNGLPQAEKINIKIKTNNGVENREVSTGNYYGFKPVEILNTKTDGVIDIESNEALQLPKGNTFDLIKVGEASAFPIAVKDFTTKRGATYKKGQIVDNSALAGLTQDGLVEYKPMMKGQVTYKVGKTEITKSVIIPANNISRSVQISAGQTDVKPTTESINGAIKEAQDLTKNLNNRAKIKTSKPTQGNKVNLSNFDKTNKTKQ